MKYTTKISSFIKILQGGYIGENDIFDAQNYKNIQAFTEINPNNWNCRDLIEFAKSNKTDYDNKTECDKPPKKKINIILSPNRLCRNNEELLKFINIMLGFTTIYKLDMSENDAAEYIFENIIKFENKTELAEIRELVLYKCKLKTCSLNTMIILFRLFNNLTYLNINNNQMSPVGARYIAYHLTNLTYLDISWNEIGDEGAIHIATKLTNLTSLNISSNEIGDKGARAVATMTNLTSLDVSSNGIGKEGAEAIAARLEKLTYLNISENKIGKEGAEAIAKMGKLTSLNISSNDGKTYFFGYK